METREQVSCRITHSLTNMHMMLYHIPLRLCPLRHNKVGSHTAAFHSILWYAFFHLHTHWVISPRCLSLCKYNSKSLDELALVQCVQLNCVCWNKHYIFAIFHGTKKYIISSCCVRPQTSAKNASHCCLSVQRLLYHMLLGTQRCKWPATHTCSRLLLLRMATEPM